MWQRSLLWRRYSVVFITKEQVHHQLLSLILVLVCMLQMLKQIEVLGLLRLPWWWVRVGRGKGPANQKESLLFQL